MGVTCSTHERDEKFITFVWKNLKKEPLGRPKDRCKNNINKNIEELVCEVIP
jgi:hypothetical protein